MTWAERLKTWRIRGAETVATLVRFLDPQPEPVRYLEDEVRGLVTPSLPLLVRKRAKFFRTMGGSAPECWRTELDFYVDRILWPMLGVADDRDGCIRDRVAAQVETLVRIEQYETGALPCTPERVAWHGG
jgi:hypothetical protein